MQPEFLVFKRTYKKWREELSFFKRTPQCLVNCLGYSEDNDGVHAFWRWHNGALHEEFFPYSQIGKVSTRKFLADYAQAHR